MYIYRKDDSFPQCHRASAHFSGYCSADGFLQQSESLSAAPDDFDSSNASTTSIEFIEVIAASNTTVFAFARANTPSHAVLDLSKTELRLDSSGFTTIEMEGDRKVEGQLSIRHSTSLVRHHVSPYLDTRSGREDQKANSFLDHLYLSKGQLVDAS
jgi:hypothetical protein